MVENKPQLPALVSYHGFILPFEWQATHSGDRLLDDRTNPGSVHAGFMADKRWTRTGGNNKPGSKTAYNEAVYFYDFVRPSLYDSGIGDTLLYSYQFNLGAEALYKIQKNSEEYHLRIDSIELRLYNTGVGVIVIQTLNEDARQADPETILKINQYGRRLFPPFYQVQDNAPGTTAYYEEANWAEGLNNHPELPDTLSIQSENVILWKESYQAYHKQPSLDLVPGILHFLLPPLFLQTAQLKPVLDDRMFVVCWYGQDALAESVKTEILQHDWWYRFVFIDVARTVQNQEMMSELIRQHSYLRWSDYGTTFGIARYSFVCLTGVGVPAYIVAHMRTLYMRMAELALVQRACVLRFSEEVTEISSLDTKDRHLHAKMESLFRQYLRFVNKMSFHEVTAQEQGIELYDMLRRSMRLDAQVAALEAEIKELHQYAAALAEADRNEKLDLLTYIGAYLAVPGFIASYYSGIGYQMNEGWHWLVMLILFSAYALTVAAMMRIKGKARMIAGFFLLLFVFFALFVVPDVFK